MNNLKKTYNKIARDYAEDHQDDPWDEGLTGKFVKAVFKQGKVLDVGCGPGKETDYLIKRGFEVTGIDLSEGMIKEAKKRAPQGNFLVMDMRQLDLPASSFDGILAKASLLHITKAEVAGVLNNFHLVLKSGGWLYLTVKEGGGEKTVVENDYGYEYSRFFSYFEKPEMEKLLRKSGFEIKQFDKWKSKSGTRWLRFLAQRD